MLTFLRASPKRNAGTALTCSCCPVPPRQRDIRFLGGVRQFFVIFNGQGLLFRLCQAGTMTATFNDLWPKQYHEGHDGQPEGQTDKQPLPAFHVYNSFVRLDLSFPNCSVRYTTIQRINS